MGCILLLSKQCDINFIVGFDRFLNKSYIRNSSSTTSLGSKKKSRSKNGSQNPQHVVDFRPVSRPDSVSITDIMGDLLSSLYYLNDCKVWPTEDRYRGF